MYDKKLPYSIKFAGEAETEIIEIFLWYRERSDKAGDDFIKYLNATFDLINENPFVFSLARKNFRQAFVKKFPFVIIYEIEGQLVLVLRIIHTSQHQKKRFKKLK